MTDEQFYAQAKRGGQEMWRMKRAEDLRPLLEEWVARQKILSKVIEMLDAKIPGTAEPDHEQVAFALLVLADTFKLSEREEIEQLLEDVRPKLASEPRAEAFLDVEGARARLRLAYEEGRISAEGLPLSVLKSPATRLGAPRDWSPAVR
jgi:hypothetical protein